MDQAKTSIGSDAAHGEHVLPIKVTGVLVHGAGGKLDLFTSPPWVRGDANLNLTCLSKALSQYFLCDDGSIRPDRPSVLYLQLDGASDNWNRTVFAWACDMVECGLLEQVELSRLKPGMSVTC